MSRSRFKGHYSFEVHPDVEAEIDKLDVPYRVMEKRSHMFLLLGKQPPILVASRGSPSKVPARTIKNCVARLRRAYQAEKARVRKKRAADRQG